MLSAPFQLTKFVFSETIGSVLRFPLWWYSDGLIRLGAWIVQQLNYRWRAYSFAIWMKNILVPMYGQYDWSGRLVSFIMRVVVLIGRGIALFVEAFLYVLLAFTYVLAPPFALVLAIYTLTVGSILPG